MNRLTRLRIWLEREVLTVGFDKWVRLAPIKSWAHWWFLAYGFHPLSFPEMRREDTKARASLPHAIWKNICFLVRRRVGSFYFYQMHKGTLAAVWRVLVPAPRRTIKRLYVLFVLIMLAVIFQEVCI